MTKTFFKSYNKLQPFDNIVVKFISRFLAPIVRNSFQDIVFFDSLRESIYSYLCVLCYFVDV